MIPTQVRWTEGEAQRERGGETEKGRGTGRIWGDEVGEGEGRRGETGKERVIVMEGHRDRLTGRKRRRQREREREG